MINWQARLTCVMAAVFLFSYVTWYCIATTRHMSTIVYIINADEIFRNKLIRNLSARDLQVEGFSCAEDFLMYDWNLHESCLITDIDLPGLNGIQLVQHMMNLQRRLPTLFIIDRYDISTAVSIMRAGARDVFEKSVSLSVLYHRILEEIHDYH